MMSLLFRFHASFYIALLFTHRIHTALLMDTSNSYCRSSRLRHETSLTASYCHETIFFHFSFLLLFFSFSFIYLP
ncbi:hypothetical protein J3R30DRAFT_3529146, partial [Lentinula aciculospora]